MPKTKKVYAVFREGVYRHECGGIFSTEELALKAANELLASEPDDYHEYVVVPFVLDVQGELAKNSISEESPLHKLTSVS